MFRVSLVAVLRPLAALVTALVLSGCALPPATVTPADPDTPARLGPEAAARQFAQVVETVEPVIERSCRARRADHHCAFQIAIDHRRRSAPNAFQTLDSAGQPVLIFTLALIADMRNPDELAFVMAHEASHHILDHLGQQRRYAEQGAREYAEVAARSGASQAAVRRASEMGAAFAARSYSRQFELQADALGTRIAATAGYDPLRGAQYFNRIPDPGQEFLGTHPPNKERMDTVRRVLDMMASGA